MKSAMPLLCLALAAFAQTDKHAKAPTNVDESTDFVRDLRGAASQQFGYIASTSSPVRDAAGKTVRFSAWIRTENVRDGYAGLWWRVDGPGEGANGRVLDFDNFQVRIIDGKPDAHNGTIRGATGTTAWTRYELELPIAKNASNISFGALLTGTGTAWVDAMTIKFDGQPYGDPQSDFDFESPTVKGFIVGCGGPAICTGYKYKVGIDNTISHSGHQSLKIQFIGDGATPK